MPEEQDVKQRVREQYGAAGDAYVRSPGHAGGDDLRRMIGAADAQPGDRALDIATGGGHVARALAPLVHDVVASDLTPEMLASAERFIIGEGVTNVRFQQADAEALPFPDGSFDIVTCRIAPHHFPNPERFVSESNRVLRPGGRFLLLDSTVPPGEIGERYNRFELMRDPSHMKSLTTPEWVAIIERSGLELTSVEHFTKRHIFRDWAARARVPEDLQETLARLLLDSGQEMAEAFRIERDGEALLAFTDEKTLFVAYKPRS